MPEDMVPTPVLTTRGRSPRVVNTGVGTMSEGIYKTEWTIISRLTRQEKGVIVVIQFYHYLCVIIVKPC